MNGINIPKKKKKKKKKNAKHDKNGTDTLRLAKTNIVRERTTENKHRKLLNR